MTQLDFRAVEAYLCFEVLKRGRLKIYHLPCLRQMESHAKSHRDDGASTNYEILCELL